MLAGIGEQFSDCVSPSDDIVGLTVGKRDKEDIIQIWNMDHNYYKNARVCEKLQELCPDVKFSVIFYKGKTKLEFLNILKNLIFFILKKAHALHEAFEGNQPSTSPHSNSNNISQKTYNNNNQHTNQHSNKNNNKFK